MMQQRIYLSRFYKIFEIIGAGKVNRWNHTAILLVTIKTTADRYRRLLERHTLFLPAGGAEDEVTKINR